MTLRELLIKNKNALCSRWFDIMADTYPPETGKFLRSKKNQFDNPVGSAVRSGMDSIFDYLVAGKAADEELKKLLDHMVRVRAIQDFSPTLAIGFLLEIKPVIREALGKDIERHGLHKEMVKLEAMVDLLMLDAFEIYVACRETLFDLRSKELRSMYAQAIKHSGMLCEVPGNLEPVPEQLEPDIK